jgi:hypothetical protein
MELTKQEFDVLGQTIADAHERDCIELDELNLIIVAGGIGEVTFA